MDVSPDLLFPGCAVFGQIPSLSLSSLPCKMVMSTESLCTGSFGSRW